MLVGEKIRDARKRRGFTLKELGVIIGVTHSALSQIENDKNDVSRKTLIALAKALGDNFGDESLDKHLNEPDTPAPSKKELAKDLSVKELVSLKFGGGGETRSKAQIRALAELLDAEIEKEERMHSLPDYKQKK